MLTEDFHESACGARMAKTGTACGNDPYVFCRMWISGTPCQTAVLSFAAAALLGAGEEEATNGSTTEG